jgi:hypothetical protein
LLSFWQPLPCRHWQALLVLINVTTRREPAINANRCFIALPFVEFVAVNAIKDDGIKRAGKFTATPIWGCAGQDFNYFRRIVWPKLCRKSGQQRHEFGLPVSPGFDKHRLETLANSFDRKIATVSYGVESGAR